MNELRMNIDHLRQAIQANRISFPAQVPIFECQSRADIQWRVVELYFIRGWSCSRLGQRYGVNGSRIRQIINKWVQRALVFGYLQEIPAAATSPEIRGCLESIGTDSAMYLPGSVTGPFLATRERAFAAGGGNT